MIMETTATTMATASAPSKNFDRTHPPVYPDMRDLAGPIFLSALFQGIQTGIILMQYSRFSARAHDREKMLVKACAAFATLLSVLQTALGFYASWVQLIDHFGDYAVAAVPNWFSKILPVTNVMLAAPVQGFLIWRCWLLMQRPKFLLVAFLIVYAANIAFSITTVLRVFSFSSRGLELGTVVQIGQPIPEIHLDPIFLCCLVLPATMDTALTTILFIFLRRSRTDAVTSHFRRVLASLILIIWEAALLPTMSAIAALVTYLIMYQRTNWDLFFFCILGQQYVIALFITFNGFHDIQKRDSEADRVISVRNLSFSTSAFSTGTRTRSNTEINTYHTMTNIGEDILSTWAREASASFTLGDELSLELASRPRESESTTARDG